MAGFLKGLFKTKRYLPSEQSPPPPQTVTYEELQTLSLQEILGIVTRLTGNQALSFYLGISRRCYEIALIDEGLSDGDRESAWKLGESAEATVRQNLTDPRALSDLNDAKQNVIERGRRFGYKSLSRLIEKQPEGTDPIAFAMLPANRPIVGPFLDIVFIDGRSDEMRTHFIKELIRQNNFGGSNAVFILHSLAARRDAALIGLFCAEEQQLLLRAPEDYGSARAILVKLGLLPASSGARPFSTVPNISGFVAMILHEAFEEADRALSETSFAQSEKELVSLAGRLLYLELASSQLTQIYGSSNVYDEFIEACGTPEINKLQTALGDIRKRSYRDDSQPVSLDMGLLVAAMTIGHSFPETEAEFDEKRPFLLSASDWLNDLRLPFLEYFRFALRSIGSSMPSGPSPEDKELLAIIAMHYRASGARSSVAEAALNFEDWIGFGDEGLISH